MLCSRGSLLGWRHRDRGDQVVELTRHVEPRVPRSQRPVALDLFDPVAAAPYLGGWRYLEILVEHYAELVDREHGPLAPNRLYRLAHLLERASDLCLFGLGLAILIDVLVVRMVIAPAVVTLLGDRAWWLPGWLARALPNVSLEGRPEAPHDDAPHDDAPKIPPAAIPVAS